MLNSLHMEYRHRFAVEFQQLLEQQTFAETIFRNYDILFNKKDAPFHHTLRHCFGCSFEGMALGLSRVWDQSRNNNTISIPNLVTIFERYDYLGCKGLQPGQHDRENYDILYADPIRPRLRVVRTEFLAHSIMLGTSRDRDNSDIKGQQFGIMNGDAINYCRKTLDLMFSLNEQLTFSKCQAKRTMDEMADEWNIRHLAFLKHFTPHVQ
ncbi:hypothetical protein [Paracoccus sp. T5]|uniref:hypothetical protein n=1 Tax=Paracoccus sp. T5 TaxID=3402161 RepID=UPI003ADF8477